MPSSIPRAFDVLATSNHRIYQNGRQSHKDSQVDRSSSCDHYFRMRETVRAVIVDTQRRTFLVQHRERNPADLGKWGNPGGGVDKTDRDHIHALVRELSEE